MAKRAALRGAVLATIFGLLAGPAAAQQSGGTLRFFHRDSPGSMSIHEEATISTVGPTMAVFNNLVLFNQHEKQNRMEFIEPELAESWDWNEDHTQLSFRLRQGIKWHDGNPFTAADVKCTWDMLTGKSPNALRLNPRGVVPQPRCGCPRRRLRGQFHAEAAATGIPVPAGRRYERRVRYE